MMIIASGLQIAGQLRGLGSRVTREIEPPPRRIDMARCLRALSAWGVI
jgi:hypothetical protein